MTLHHVDGIGRVLHGYGHSRAEHRLQPPYVAFGTVGYEYLVGLDPAAVEPLRDRRAELAHALLVAVARVPFARTEPLGSAAQTLGDERTQGLGRVPYAQAYHPEAGMAFLECLSSAGDLGEEIARRQIGEASIAFDPGRELRPAHSALAHLADSPGPAVRKAARPEKSRVRK